MQRFELAVLMLISINLAMLLPQRLAMSNNSLAQLAALVLAPCVAVFALQVCHPL